MKLSELVRLVRAGVSSGEEPEAIEYTKIGDLFWVNLIHQKTDDLISDQIFSGFDVNYATALSKAISEKIEREAFQSGHDRKLASCNTDRSDGFAAFPTMAENSLEHARSAALSEAIERYVWATWWDDSTIKHSHDVVDDFSVVEQQLGVSASLFRESEKWLKFRKLHFISPLFTPFFDRELIILVAELDDGVVTGGACGLKIYREHTLTRGMSELFRHGLALSNKNSRPHQASFYERRLLHLATKEGLVAFRNRLALVGTKAVEMPSLAIDELIPHANCNTHHVYRCLFSNQPPFVGGRLERMCL